MRHLISLLSLPNSLLLLLSVSPSPVTPEEPWPYNLPKHLKYFPEDEVHIKRGLKIQERLARESPISVKKMSTDEGEMFFLDYWLFEGAQDMENTDRRGPINLGRRERDFSQRPYNWSSSDELSDNSNASLPIFSPLRLHSDQTGLRGFYHRYIQRDTLFGRDFRCPDGTSNCSSIGQPDSCCSTADSCISITDTGYGTVGCCPIGQTCAGSISCDTANGYSSCPNSPNGGCCLPGYGCIDVGCVITGTSTATAMAPTATVIASPSSSLLASSSAAVSSVVVSSSIPISSTAIVVVPTTPSSSSAYTCSSGWHSCPASLGGGCCQSGRDCGSGIICPGSSTSTLSSVAPSAPVRPTSGSVTSVTTTISASSSISLCPTGFYVCSAYYPTGCCRVGRDCATSSCPTTASTRVVVSNGITIIAPSGASFATTAAIQGGTCPSGWYSCAASLGGNCCLNGYSCGAQCTATGTGGQTQVAGKVAPSAANNVGMWPCVQGE